MATTSKTQAQKAPNKSINGAASRKPTPSSTASKTTPKSAAQSNGKVKPPVRTKAASIAGESPVTGVTSAYAIMASRIANRVAEMAESLTFVERSPAKEPAYAEPETSRRPRKLEMRLNASGPDAVAFSAPFLDNTLQKMLALQNRMLTSTAELSRADGLDERVVKEHAAQSAELSRIIALICAEKARQGA